MVDDEDHAIRKTGVYSRSVLTQPLPRFSVTLEGGRPADDTAASCRVMLLRANMGLVAFMNQ